MGLSIGKILESITSEIGIIEVSLVKCEIDYR